MRYHGSAKLGRRRRRVIQRWEALAARRRMAEHAARPPAPVEELRQDGHRGLAA